MKRKLATILMSLAMFGVLVLPAAARTVTSPQDTSGVDRREREQQRRIRRGYRHGGLTRREATRLERREWRIRRAEMRVRSDGRVSRSERRRLNRMQNRVSRRIHRQRYDQQRRSQ